MSEQQQTPEIATTSQKFLSRVERQYNAELGDTVPWTNLQKVLAQHMYLHINASIKALNMKRDPDKQITWEKVNMQQLSEDVVKRISLGLDALIKNHIHVIPYWNSSARNYTIDLRIGYKGVEYCRPKYAVDPPLSVHVELVHETDVFEPHFKDRQNECDSYSFKVTSPFNRGKVVGGFGYIQYDDHRKNRLILVDQRDLERAEAFSQTPKDFWAEGKHREEMQYKTAVHRVYDKIPLDPAKVNDSNFQALQNPYLDSIEAEIDEIAATNGLQSTIDIHGRETEVEVVEVQQSLPEATVATDAVVTTVAEPEPVVVSRDPAPRFGK